MDATKQTTTVTVDLEPEDIANLRALARRRGMTLTQVLRRAIAQSRRLNDLLDEGGNLILEEPDKSLTRLVVR